MKTLCSRSLESVGVVLGWCAGSGNGARWGGSNGSNSVGLESVSWCKLLAAL